MARKVLLTRRKSSDNLERVPLVPNEHNVEELPAGEKVKTELNVNTNAEHKVGNEKADEAPDNQQQTKPAFSMKLTKEERRRLECVLIEINLREYNF